MRGAPWHVEGIDPGALELAQDAARRSGLSIGEWLNSVIIDAKDKAGFAPDRVSDHPPNAAQGRDKARDSLAVSEATFADERNGPAPIAQQRSAVAQGAPCFDDISSEIEELKSRIEHLMQPGNAGAPTLQPDLGSRNRPPGAPFNPHPASSGTVPKYPSVAPPGSHLAETIARIDRQLEAMRRNGRPAGTPQKQSGVDEAFAEIAARQQALDFAPPEAAHSVAAPEREPSTLLDVAALEHRLSDIADGIKKIQPSCRFDDAAIEFKRGIERAVPREALVGIEDHLRRLSGQLESVRAPAAVDRMFEELRSDLATIGRRIEEALPAQHGDLQQQINALAGEVAKLNTPQHADEIATALRGDLADIREALKNGMPQSDVAAIEEALRQLAHAVVKLNAWQRGDEIVGSLRRDIADIRMALDAAVPRFDVTAIEDQIGRLAHEFAKLNESQCVEEVADVLRADIADIRTTLHNTMTRFDPASIEEQLHGLAHEVRRLQLPQRAEEIAQGVRADIAGLRAELQSGTPRFDEATIEEQIQALSVKVAGLQAPPRVEDIANALRNELAEIGEALRKAMPTDAIATLEREVRMLGDRLDADRESRPTAPAVAGLESTLAELHVRIRDINPAQDVAALHESILALSRKADSLASENLTSEVLRQLEQAIWALRDLSSQVASQDSVIGLSRDIHALGDKIDRSGRHDFGQDVLVALEQRLAEMADAIGRRPSESAIPTEFESTIKRLADRLEATHLPTADPEVLKSLERRIISLDEKLDASETGLSRLDGVERGIDDLLVQLKELRTQNERKLAAIQQQQMMAATAEAVHGSAEVVRRDVAMLKDIQGAADRRTQETFEAVYGTVEQVVDRLATIEQSLRNDEAARAAMVAAPPAVAVDGPPIAPPGTDRNGVASENPVPPLMYGVGGASAKARAATWPPAAALLRQPLVSDLPPDAPLEPGSGGRRVRMFPNEVDRGMGSEVLNDTAKSGEAMPTRANFVAAARRAAHAVASEQADATATRDSQSATHKQRQSRTKGLIGRFGPKIKSVILGISVILLVLGALRLAMDLFFSQEGAPAAQMIDPVPPVQPTPSPPPSPPSPPANAARPGRGAALEAPPAATHSSAMPGGEPGLGPLPASGFLGASPMTNQSTGSVASPPDTAPTSAPPSQARDTTGALVPQAPLSLAPPQGASLGASSGPSVGSTGSPSSRDLASPAPLPGSIGGKVLLNAAAAGEPGASYEIAIRYAEGHNAPQDFGQAAIWFDRAARTGLAPAQFRLGSMYEKGLGVKKDLQEARRLYLAAADKGNAKAMHNLAVLYSEGLDGKPDYAVAAQWFRKAASFGVGDSQYNLAILYARGIGVERNMAESYKWFALAAKGGDKDAAKKRDEMAARLDPESLESTRHAIEAFGVERQPDEATDAKAPPGGWDQVVAAGPAKRKATH
jgi:localization factor PodJL